MAADNTARLREPSIKTRIGYNGRYAFGFKSMPAILPALK
jgi:hypothetical protein